MIFQTEEQAIEHWRNYYIPEDDSYDAFCDWLIDNAVGIEEDL